MKAPPDRAVRMDSRPCAAVRAKPRIAAVFGRREQVRLQHLVDLFQNVGDAKFGGFFDRGFEIAPEPLQHVLPFAFAGRDVVQFFFQIRR